jgi:hypothetical protein
MGEINAHTPGGDDDGFPIFNHGGGPLRQQEGGMRIRAPLVATRYGVAMRKNSPTVHAPEHALPFQCPEVAAYGDLGHRQPAGRLAYC